MSLIIPVQQLIGQPASSILEYKAVLPTSRALAQLISSFANAEGGYIVLGVFQQPDGEIEIKGLSEDFLANSITHKAIDLLTPKPPVIYNYLEYQDKKLFVITVGISAESVSVDGKIFKREGANTILENPPEVKFKKNGYERIKNLFDDLEKHKQGKVTNANSRFLEHYQSILKIVDDLEKELYPVNPNQPTNNSEGKVLSRILFSSYVDNFETYLSDLLYEIFLAKPETLKSEEPVTIEEVLNFSDLQEFVKYWAKHKIGKLQKGSVKGFIKENKQISKLGVIDEAEQNEIEKTLQIRHLYSHRNGIVDEKFLRYFPTGWVINSEHQLSIYEFCDKLVYLVLIVQKIDLAASSKFKLATIN